VLAALAALHVYWAAGGRRGSLAVVPTARPGGPPAFTPTAAQSLGVAAALTTAAGCYVAAGAGRAPPPWVRLGASGAASVLLLRAAGDGRSVGFTKRRLGTRFARLDTTVFAPLCLLLAAAGAVAVAPRSS
jgi:hypothetical protein